MGITMVGHCPTFCLPDVTVVVTVHDQISRTFPLRICILQDIKHYRWEWPGNKVRGRIM